LHLKLYRFSPSDYLELAAVFNGPHPETKEPLQVVDEAPDGFPWPDTPPQPAVFAPDYAPEEIAEIAQKLRKRAGLPDEPTGAVSHPGAWQALRGGPLDKVAEVAEKLKP
jgi:Mn-containing catalase